ncbi:FadR/GntR family transcriptional regulator [Rodentibacter abscessus]|uniref:FadR/GntR family transcriptional regulator n=2 Tax=Rodentibacter TaxID=1960084 RepID=UPI0020848179|nr:transcriptional regulator [Rodentibacter sp. JRC1]
MKTMNKKEASLELQDKIKALIIKRNLKSGDLMPTENELIELLNVSRSSLREAIKSLEALHIVDIKHGIGTFVSESSLVPMIRGLSFHTQLNLRSDLNQLINILDIREILEYGFAPMVLAKITNEKVTALQKYITNMEKNAKNQKFSPKDEYRLHVELYEPLNNPLLLQYLDAFWQIYHEVEKDLPEMQLSAPQMAMLHKELIDAVETRDLVRMQLAILHYFKGIRQRLLQGEENE